MTASRRFLAALATATVLTWVLGDPRIVWHDIATLVPGTVEQAGQSIELDGAGGQVVEPLPVPMPVVPGVFGVEVSTAASIHALDAHPELGTPYPALVQLSFLEGEQRLAVASVAKLSRGERSVAERARATMPRGTTHIQLDLIVGAGVGAHDFAVAPVRFAERSRTYLAAAALLASAWVLLGASLIRAGARVGVGRHLRLACIGALLIIVAGTGLSESLPLPGFSEGLRAVLRTFSGNATSSAAWIPLAGHVAAFALLAVVAEALRRRLKAGRRTMLAALVLLALASEAFQRHLPDRSSSVEDLLADLAAIVVVLLVIGLAHALRHGLRDSLSWRPTQERRAAARRREEQRLGGRPGKREKRRRRRRRSRDRDHAPGPTSTLTAACLPEVSADGTSPGAALATPELGLAPARQDPRDGAWPGAGGRTVRESPNS